MYVGYYNGPHQSLIWKLFAYGNKKCIEPKLVDYIISQMSDKSLEHISQGKTLLGHFVKNFEKCRHQTKNFEAILAILITEIDLETINKDNLIFDKITRKSQLIISKLVKKLKNAEIGDDGKFHECVNDKIDDKIVEPCVIDSPNEHDVSITINEDAKFNSLDLYKISDNSSKIPNYYEFQKSELSNIFTEFKIESSAKLQPLDNYDNNENLSHQNDHRKYINCTDKPVTINQNEFNQTDGFSSLNNQFDEIDPLGLLFGNNELENLFPS